MDWFSEAERQGRERERGEKGTDKQVGEGVVSEPLLESHLNSLTLLQPSSLSTHAKR